FPLLLGYCGDSWLTLPAAPGSTRLFRWRLVRLAERKRRLHDGGMPTAGTPAAAPAAMDDSSKHRWAEMLDGLAGLLPGGSRRVLVDGPPDRASLFAALLSERLAAGG